MIDQILVLSRVLTPVRRKDVVALKLGGKGALTELEDESDDEEEEEEENS